MGKNLNQDLYRRFGLELELKTVQNGFRKYIKGILITLPSPDENVLMRICKRLFLDRESYEDQFDVYESTGDFKRLIRKEFDNFEGSFEEYILRLQILLEALYSSENFDRVFLDRLLYIPQYLILLLPSDLNPTRVPFLQLWHTRRTLER